jgi:peptidoglycan LD-endopeptidase CwlK
LRILKITLIAISLGLCSFGLYHYQMKAAPIPIGILKLQKAYPNHIKSISNNSIMFYDGFEMIYDDGIEKTIDQKLENPDLEDMMSIPYKKGNIGIPTEEDEAGRIRVDAFFKKIYGSDSLSIVHHLRYVDWLPYGKFRHVKMNSINNVHEHIQQVAIELNPMEPRFHKYFYKLGGTFFWRTVEGKPRLSPHSFGIAIDLNTKYSKYWDWDDAFGKKMQYNNEIPWEIVEIFERHGFIWGGKWYHYDTMHFEYRPELLVDL